MSDPQELNDVEALSVMRSIIQRIATGPEMSKDISRDEARLGMRAILEGRIDPVQTAVFLIALRMKRETDEENVGVLQAIVEATDHVQAEVDDVLQIADPYDGYNRVLPAAPFLPPVLAACGAATVSHGLNRVGPKNGITHRHVLAAAGKDVDLSPTRVAARLAESGIGWGYVDQASYCPSLHDLVDLRARMVKRSVLTTVEVLANPLRGRRQTRLMTGYVHKLYPRIYALLARAAGYDSALIVRGVEGGVIPSLRQPAKIYYYHDMGEERFVETLPGALGIEQSARAVPLPEGAEDITGDNSLVVEAAAEAGIEALGGMQGPTRDSLVYAAGMALWHVGRADSAQSGCDAVREVLDSGAALERFNAG